MIGIGGDGSMAILRSLAQQGNFNWWRFKLLIRRRRHRAFHRF